MSFYADSGIDSIGPDKGIMVDVYSDMGCGNRILQGMVYPGYDDLHGQYSEANGFGQREFGVMVWTYQG